MRVITKIIILCLLLMSVSISSASGVPRKLLETNLYDYGWEADMGALDLLSNELRNESDSVGYIIIYGAKHGRRGEVERRMSCMKNYMLERRGFRADQINVAHGGYRERAVMELWIVPRGERAPNPTPTIKSKDVKLRKGKVRYSCEV